MTDARSLTMALGGRWHGRYGTAPCPVCQPERRKDQNALTLADGRDGRLLASCKKSACAFSDIIRAAGIAPGEYQPPDPAILAQREREAAGRSPAQSGTGEPGLAGSPADSGHDGRDLSARAGHHLRSAYQSAIPPRVLARPDRQAAPRDDRDGGGRGRLRGASDVSARGRRRQGRAGRWRQADARGRHWRRCEAHTGARAACGG